MIRDYFRLAVENIHQRKVRSWLTILGIVIGIAAVVSLVSLGQGVEKYINDEFAKLGVDKIFVSPVAVGTQGSIPLLEADLTAVERTRGVKDVAGTFFRSARFEYRRNQYFTILIGMPTDEKKALVEEAYNLQYSAGRGLKSGDQYKAVVSYYVAKGDTFDEPVGIGDKITIEGRDFEVVGILKSMGDPGVDTSVIIPVDTIHDQFDIQFYHQIIARTEKGLDPLPVSEDIKKNLRKSRDVKEGEENFEVQTTEQLVDSFNTIIGALSAIVIGIAAISLFVGAVGIMNTMYTAVLQRTNEIGVMKAIGARNSQIMTVFLIESGILGLIGGVIGIIIGVGLSKIMEFIGKTFLDTQLLQAYFPWYLILGSLLFAFVIGMLSGMLPARQASQLKPVDALRYE